MKKSLLIIVLIISLTFVTACAQKTEAPDAMKKADPESSSGGEVMMEDKMMKEDGAMMEKEGEAMEMNGAYNLDPASRLGWSAKRLAANPHVGTVAIQSGQLNFDAGKLVGGEFVIDMTQITESKNSQGFLRHIRSDDFFGVEQFPTAKLEVTEWQGGQVAGNLTIRDKTNQISFPANIQMADGKLTATAEFDIDRTLWDINFDSGSVFQNLGDRAIKDEISFDLDLVMTP